jgi:GNAT superfamily N-acetyltransferase
MSVIVRHCTVAEILQAPNIDQIAAEYASESSIKGMPHPVGKMEMYHQLEAVGALSAFGAFVDDLPVGFITVLSTIMPHYSVYLTVSESFFVLKAHRKTGAGLRLLRMAEDRAREVGAPGLLVSAPYGGVLADVLPGVGYTPSNTVFFKGFRDV